MPFSKESLLSMLGPAQTPERCGFISAAGEIVECRNIAPDPLTCFDVSADDIIEHAEGAMGTWHTHPGDSSNISRDDWYYCLNFPDIVHFIVGVDGVAGYRVDRGVVINA